jgi:hypothetical protein
VTTDCRGLYGLVAVAATARLLLSLQTTDTNAEEDLVSRQGMPEPVRTLFARLPEALDGWSAEGMEGAIALQMFPLAGREDLVARFDPSNLPPCEVLEGDPFEVIAERARDAQIVIVNEAHDQPFHRQVIEHIGRSLAEDFGIFAAETLSYDALAQREDGEITAAIGSYSDEPMFARELRALDAAGYRFVAYEITKAQRAPEAASDAERVKVREKAQATNLIEAVLDEDPNARVLVHVGYAHAYETPIDNFGEEIEWFAARLKRKTGIDPLTISQTTCTVADRTAENALDGLRLVDGEAALPKPGAVDLVLAHPPLQFRQSRPAWRRAIGDVAVKVPEAFKVETGRIVIEARKPGQSIDEVPADRIVLYPGESIPLLLPPGEWRLIAWDERGQRHREIEVTVKGQCDAASHHGSTSEGWVGAC